MYTRHGHHIPGTGMDHPNDRKIQLCGGVHICPECKEDVDLSDGVERCHCGEEVAYFVHGEDVQARNVCGQCYIVRCDAYAGECAK